MVTEAMLLQICTFAERLIELASVTHVNRYSIKMKVSQKISNLNASNFRDILTLKLVTNASDGEGGFTATVSTIKTIFAKVEPKNESRTLDEKQLEYVAAFQIYCRYDATIDNSKLFEYKGQTLTIHSCVDIGGLNQFLSILAYSNE